MVITLDIDGLSEIVDDHGRADFILVEDGHLSRVAHIFWHCQTL
jgi:hypothetical protein